MTGDLYNNSTVTATNCGVRERRKDEKTMKRENLPCTIQAQQRLFRIP